MELNIPPDSPPYAPPPPPDSPPPDSPAYTPPPPPPPDSPAYAPGSPAYAPDSPPYAPDFFAYAPPPPPAPDSPAYAPPPSPSPHYLQNLINKRKRLDSEISDIPPTFRREQIHSALMIHTEIPEIIIFIQMNGSIPVSQENLGNFKHSNIPIPSIETVRPPPDMSLSISNYTDIGNLSCMENVEPPQLNRNIRTLDALTDLINRTVCSDPIRQGVCRQHFNVPARVKRYVNISYSIHRRHRNSPIVVMVQSIIPEDKQNQLNAFIESIKHIPQ